MRTWGSRVLRASSRAGMRRAAWGFSLAPAVLLIFTRVWMLREGEKQTGYRLQTKAVQATEERLDQSCRYLRERTSDTLLTMPFSSSVGSITATVLWAAEPVDSHIRVHTCTERHTHTVTHAFLNSYRYLTCRVENGRHLAERLQSEVCSFSHRFLRNQEIVT